MLQPRPWESQNFTGSLTDSDLNLLTSNTTKETVGLEFDFISYEHDKYNSGDKYEQLSENFLLSQNYKIAIKDVYSRSKKHKIYETWFTNKDIDFENISYDDWKKTRYKKNRFIR